MNVTFFKNSSDKTVVSKILESPLQIENVNILTPSSVINPVLTIKTSDSVITYNYLHIPDFKRYYFIEDITALRGFSTGEHLWQISCHVDVLKSFENDIHSQTAIIDRQEKLFNPLMVDGEIPFSKNPYIENLEFPSGFPIKPIGILVTVGSGS